MALIGRKRAAPVLTEKERVVRLAQLNPQCTPKGKTPCASLPPLVREVRTTARIPQTLKKVLAWNSGFLRKDGSYLARLNLRLEESVTTQEGNVLTRATVLLAAFSTLSHGHS